MRGDLEEARLRDEEEEKDFLSVSLGFLLLSGEAES